MSNKMLSQTKSNSEITIDESVTPDAKSLLTSYGFDLYMSTNIADSSHI